jgi:acyl-coenzyme A thioesterase PaaI-like protein
MIEHVPKAMSFTVAGPDGEVFATGSASCPEPFVITAEHPDEMLTPVVFAFDAERDLAFTRTLVDHDFWQQRGWAHPAWLASAANAIIGRNVDFASPEHWLHAGLELVMRAPIVADSTVVVGGCIAERFTGRRHRFAVGALEARVDGTIVATMRTTFAYAPIDADDADDAPIDADDAPISADVADEPAV